MKNWGLLIPIFLLLIFSCQTSAPVTVEEDVKEEVVVEEEGPVARTVIITEAKPLIEIRYSEDGYKEDSKQFTYNDENLLIKEDLYNTFDELVESTVYEYDNNLLVKKSVYDASNQLVSYRLYTYNDMGLLATEELYNRDEVLQTSSEYSYDPEGHKSEWKVFDSMGAILNTTIYVCEGDHPVRVELIDGQDILYEIFEYQYDENGRLVNERNLDTNNILKKEVVYTYSDLEWPEKEEHFLGNGSLVRTVQYLYDDVGGVLREDLFNSLGELREYTEREFFHVDTEITVWE